MTDVVSQPAEVATSIESQPSPQPVIKVEPAVTQHQQPPDTNSENSQNGTNSISNVPSPAVPDITDSPKKPVITEKPDIAPDGKLVLNAEPKVTRLCFFFFYLLLHNTKKVKTFTIYPCHCKVKY